MIESQKTEATPNQASSGSAAGPWAKPPSRRLEFIEGMRAVAALYVVFGHVAAFVDPSRLEGKASHVPVWLQKVLGPFGYGHLAVAAFIVISGFCLRWAARQRRDPDAASYWGFMGRRAKRILPPYYGCLVLSLLVALLVTPIPGRMPFTQYLPVSEPVVLSHFLLIHNFRPEWMYKINGVLWSISIEFQIYFLYPLFARMLRAKPSEEQPDLTQVWLRRVAVVAACAAFSLVVIYGVHRGMKLYPWFTAFFAVGMIGADIAEHVSPKSRRVLWTLAWIGLTFAVVGSCLDWEQLITQIGIAATSISLLILGTARQTAEHPDKYSSLIENVFGRRRLAFIGTFSFSLYLIHHPILQCVDVAAGGLYHHPVRHLVFLLLVGVPIAVIGSYWFAKVFEGRYLKRALADLNPVASAKSQPV